MRRGLAAVLSLSLMSVAVPDGVGAPSKAKRRKVERLKKRAFRKFAKGKYEAGITAMQQAHDLIAHPGFLLNIAVAYDQWGGHCDDALDTFQRLFETCGPGCALRDSAEARHRKVRQKCQLDVTISTVPQAAELYVAGESRGATPQKLRLDAGAHEVRLRLEGHEPFTTTVRVARRTLNQFEFRLKPIRVTLAEPPPPPVPDPEPPPPQVTLETPAPAGPSLVPWAWTAAGIGVAGAGLGTGLWLRSRSTLDERQSAIDNNLGRQAVENLENQARTEVRIAQIGFGVAGAGVVTAVVLWILDGDSNETPDAITLRPTIGPGQAGIHGRF